MSYKDLEKALIKELRAFTGMKLTMKDVIVYSTNPDRIMHHKLFGERGTCYAFLAITKLFVIYK